MDDAPLVYFVLTSETGGVDSGTGKSILRNVLLPSFAVCLASFIIIALSNMISTQRLPYPMFSIKLNILLLAYTAVIMAIKLKAWKYLYIFIRVHKKPAPSKFYEAYYRDPKKISILPPKDGKKKNIIIIFMESMEATFSLPAEDSLLPHITSLAKEGISFGSDSERVLGGGLNLDGTSWTVAAIISKLSGLPYFNPFDGHGKKRAALRGALTLSDILCREGYQCVFSMGSEKRFEGRDAFLDVHGFQVHDIDWYKENGFIEEGYKVFWGFEDRKLYDAARKETKKLAEEGKPFCYAMLTVDTHFPDGYRCPLCPKESKKQIEDVIHCADNQVHDFVLWCKRQEWYKDTAIVIMGDHNYLGAPCNDFVKERLSKLKGQYKERRWLNVILNAEKKAMAGSDRKFSSYDIFPTIIEAAGFSIEGGGLAFGRSLFQEGKTLVEELGEEKVEDFLMRRTEQYEKLKKDLSCQ